MQLVRDVEFDSMYLFKYSPRPGTRAATFADQVSETVKSERFNALLAVQEAIQMRRNRARIGRCEEVLVEGPSKKGSVQLTGRTRQNRPVNFVGHPSLTGSLVTVRIEQGGGHSLEGKVCAERSDRGGEGWAVLQMVVKGLTLDPLTNMPIVILKDVEGNRALPIWIGANEANAIAMEMERITTPRPMTHDLIRNILEGLKAKVSRIVVNDLRDNTFYAVIFLAVSGTEVAIDSRPSDAIALALRVKAPIFVAEKVIREAKSIDLTEDKPAEDSQSVRDWIENLKPEDFGRIE
jgi:bifunctional DNase/RNase